MPPPPVMAPRGSPPGPTPEMKRNPPRQSQRKNVKMSRPDLAAARGGVNFNDAENMDSNYGSANSRAEMKGPGDLRDDKIEVSDDDTSDEESDEDPTVPRTKDMTFTMSVTLDELFTGAKKKLALRRKTIDKDGSYEEEKKKLSIKKYLIYLQ